MVANNVTVAQSAKKMYSWNKDLQGIAKKLKLGDNVPHYSLNDEFAYNRRVHSTIGMSPFEADLGYSPYMPDEVLLDPELNKLEKAAKALLLRQEVFLKVAKTL
ncbi:hypothetical protein PInf_017099 [Phytophthora infestans]|nr:hypothetical protein PInf_017099 [Phytophthora infestans]